MERVKTITRRIEHNDLTVVEAAGALNISEHQMYRVLARHRTEGGRWSCAPFAQSTPAEAYTDKHAGVCINPTPKAKQQMR
jgi:hypothetical protein